MKVFLIFFPLFLLGAQGANADYDIIPRTVNFVIFLLLLYYFVSKPFKNFYKARIVKISSRLDDIQRKLVESKNKKLDTAKKLEELKADSSAALITAKKEAEVLVSDLKKQTEYEISLLDKHFEEQQDYALRMMEKDVISKTLKELFNDKDIRLSQAQILELINKKVS